MKNKLHQPAQQTRRYVSGTLALLVAGCAATGESDWAKEQYRHYRVTYEEHIVIETYPAGAEVYLDDQFIGTSPAEVRLTVDNMPVYWKFKRGTGHFDPLQLDRDKVAFTQHLLGVTHPGFYQAREVISVAESPALASALGEYLPNPEKGSGQAQNTVPAVLTGTRSVRIDLLPEATGGELPAPPPPVATVEGEKGQLNIVSNDPAADIYVDGRFVGNAPVTLQLEAGTHQIELKRGQSAVYARQIEIFGGSQATLNAAIE